jgi:integrase
MATVPKRKPFKVWLGNTHLTVYPWTHPTTGKDKWRYCWQARAGDVWRYVTRGTKDEAISAAEKTLASIQTGRINWETLPPRRLAWIERIHEAVSVADEAAVLAFLAGRSKSADVAACVERFIGYKVSSKGKDSAHLRQLKRDLDAMAAAFPGRMVSDIPLDDLSAFLDARTGTAGLERRQGVRRSLVAFWRWCRKDGTAGPDAVTVAERLPSVTVGHGKRRVLTAAELLAIAAEIKPEWRAWVALGAFAGLRPEEVAPKSDDGKPGLRVEHIDWTFGCIRVPAEVAKNRVPRIIPMTPCLIDWLDWADIRPDTTDGPICLVSPSEVRETTRVGKAVFKDAGWPKDALRHSFGSYRNAVLRHLPQVAEEMGTSQAMLAKHYHNPQPTEVGEAWFALVPPKAEPRAKAKKSAG